MRNTNQPASKSVARSERVRPAPRKRMRGAVRRALLLEAADDLLRKEGIKALTMDRLALTAEVSKPVVYSHFRNRTDLIITLLQEYWAYVDRRRGADIREYSEAGVRHWVSSYLDVILERGSAYRQLLHKVLEDPSVEAARSERETQVIARITKTILSSYDISPVAAKSVAGMFRSALEACGVQAVANARQRPLIEGTFVTLVLSTLRGLAADKDAAGRRT